MDANPRRSIFNPRVRKEREDNRFALSAKKYLEKYYILRYIQDAVSLMLENKCERPLHFLADYFLSIEKGANVLHRNFRYVNCTPRNRQSFIQQFYDAYKSIDEYEELSIDSFHQLLTLLCRDFPYSLVRNASRITMEVKEIPTKVAFSEFSLKIFILFFFSEFMNQSALSFRTIDKNATGKVKVGVFMEHLKQIIDKQPTFRYAHNKINSWGDAQNEVMFNEFCVKLFSHPDMKRALQYAPPYDVLKAKLGKLAKQMQNGGSKNKLPPSPDSKRMNHSKSLTD